MVAGGARALAVRLPGGTARPEVKPAAKTLYLCLTGNDTLFGNTNLHAKSEDMVKQSTTLDHDKPQVNSTKQGMDTQLFSPLFGGITNTPLTVESPQLCSSWSTCGDDTNAVASLQDCTKKRAQVNLSYSGSGPDMFGLVTSILEEPSKQEPVTDWNSLSKLFPPMWSSELENHGGCPGLFPEKNLENQDLNNVAGTQNPYDENFQSFSSVESLQKEPEDLPVIGSWFSPSNPCIQSPEEILKTANPGSKAFQSKGINQQGTIAYQNVRNYAKKQWNSESGKSPTGFSTSSSQSRIKYSLKTCAEYQKVDKAGVTHRKNKAEGPSQYFTPLSNSPADGIWDPVIQGNNLSPERCTGFTAANGSRQFSCPPQYFASPAFNKENRFPEGMNTKLEETHLGNERSSISMDLNFGNPECKVLGQPQKGSCSPLPLKLALQNMNSAYNGYTWLDSKIVSPVAPSYVTYEKQNQMGTPLSSKPHSQSCEPSTDNSEAQPDCSQPLPGSSSRKDEKLQMSVNTPSSSGFFSVAENQKRHNPIGRSQNGLLATTEGRWSKVSMNGSFSGASQQNSVSEAAKCHRFRSKQSQRNTNGRSAPSERNNWISHPSYAVPNCAQLDVLRKQPEQNGDSLSDFINPSFFPLFPLASGYKHTPNFPQFTPHPFSSPANVAFSPLPFPLSELTDFFRYNDFHHLSPFINDLLCGDIAAPYFAFPPPLSSYRPPKQRSGPANELHIHLEECYEQWRVLERERKKAETDLARNFPGKPVSSSNSVPFSRLPAKPSRVDRLIADQFREQGRVQTLIGKMEKLCGTPVHSNICTTLGRHLESICATQARRKDEIVNAANRHRQGTSRYSSEKDVLTLAAAIKDLALSTRKTRTALWCAFQMTLPKTSASTLVKKEDVERALQDLSPIGGSSPAQTDVGYKDQRCNRKSREEPQQVIK